MIKATKGRIAFIVGGQALLTLEEDQTGLAQGGALGAVGRIAEAVGATVRVDRYLEIERLFEHLVTDFSGAFVRIHYFGCPDVSPARLLILYRYALGD